MPRKPRIHFPGAVYHVILRGNGGQDIFFDVADRSRFFLLLQEGRERFGHRIHSFCLMSNHVHLAIQVRDLPLSRIMQNLSFRYTQYLNRKRDKTGHLFQGRYKALLIDADSYLLELVRYIHLNPVRANMVEHPDSYPWSGHRAYVGKETLPWLTTDWVLGQFALNSEDSIRRYKQFIADGLQENYREAFHSGTFEGRVLGDDTFIEAALAQAEEPPRRQFTVESVIEAVCAAYGLSMAEIASRSKTRKITEARAIAALLVREAEGVSLANLAKRFGQDLSSLSQSARRLELRVNENNHLAGKLEAVKKKIPICQA